MSDTIEARVARGAAWLDENKPGWERLVDLAALDLARSCKCVLGQVFAAEARESARDPRWFPLTGFNVGSQSCPDVVGCGFEALPNRWPQYPREYAELDEAWIALIKERFASGLLSDEAS